MPAALSALLALGIDPPGHDITGITYRQQNVVADAPFRHGPGRGVRRTVLHAALREAAQMSGVTILQRAVTHVEQYPTM